MNNHIQMLIIQIIISKILLLISLVQSSVCKSYILFIVSFMMMVLSHLERNSFLSMKVIVRRPLILKSDYFKLLLDYSQYNGKFYFERQLHEDFLHYRAFRIIVRLFINCIKTVFIISLFTLKIYGDFF